MSRFWRMRLEEVCHLILPLCEVTANVVVIEGCGLCSSGADTG